MRKVDYQTLALKINTLRTRALEGEKYSAKDAERSAFFYGKSEGLRMLALECADKLHVDKEQFLHACGID